MLVAHFVHLHVHVHVVKFSLLEIGWSTWDSFSGEIASYHHIVEEGLSVSNGRYVPDHRHDFVFGSSSVGPMKAGAKALQKDLEVLTWMKRWKGSPEEGGGGLVAPPRVALVGHGMAADLKMLDGMGVVIPPGEAGKVQFGLISGLCYFRVYV